MSTLYFHIGWRKAGSSAIQGVLSDPDDRHLFADYFLPEAGRKPQSNVVGGTPEAHHLLGSILQPSRARKAWKALREEAEGHDKTLISSEIFSGHMARAPQDMDATVSDWLAPFERVKFLAIFRRQDEFISSMHVQEAKHGDTGGGTGSSLTTYLKDADYWTACNRIEQLHPNATIEAIGYSRDVLSGFFDLLGINYAPKPDAGRSRLNTRVCPSVYRLQTILNHAVADDLSVKWLKVMVDRNLHLLGDLDGPGVIANPLRISERIAILEHFWEGNQKFCAKYGLDPAGFDPAGVTFSEDAEYNIPDKVAEETLAEIMRRLGETMHRKLTALVR